MAAKLNLAHLSYGSTVCSVEPNAITPLPEVFDFENPEACAKIIFAIMSNASGGHPLKGCKLQIHRGRESANMTANGVHVYYANPETPKFADVQAAMVARGEMVVYQLGNVIATQYGDGWKSAVWTE